MIGNDTIVLWGQNTPVQCVIGHKASVQKKRIAYNVLLEYELSLVPPRAVPFRSEQTFSERNRVEHINHLPKLSPGTVLRPRPSRTCSTTAWVAICLLCCGVMGSVLKHSGSPPLGLYACRAPLSNIIKPAFDTCTQNYNFFGRSCAKSVYRQGQSYKDGAIQ